MSTPLQSPPEQRRSPIAGLRLRFFSTLVIAAVGAVGGLAYAYSLLPPDQLTPRSVALYGAMGATIAILGVRLARIIRLILADYFGAD